MPIGRLLLRGLVEASRTGDKAPFVGYCEELARRRVRQGVEAEEVVLALRTLERVCMETLRGDARAARLSDVLRDHVEVTLEFGIDRVLEVYEDEDDGGAGRSG